jgi:hypothetical protein
LSQLSTPPSPTPPSKNVFKIRPSPVERKILQSPKLARLQRELEAMDLKQTAASPPQSKAPTPPAIAPVKPATVTDKKPSLSSSLDEYEASAKALQERTEKFALMKAVNNRAAEIQANDSEEEEEDDLASGTVDLDLEHEDDNETKEDDDDEVEDDVFDLEDTPFPPRRSFPDQLSSRDATQAALLSGTTSLNGSVILGPPFFPRWNARGDPWTMDTKMVDLFPFFT